MVPGAPAVAVPGDHDAPPCASGQVGVSVSEPQAAAGHRGVTLIFALANGAAPCTLTGYPRVESAGGGPFDHARPTLRGYMGGLPDGVDGPPTVTLAPSQLAQSVLESVADDGSSDQCTGMANLSVIPPGTTAGVAVGAPIDGCQLQVHPVTPVTIEPGPPPPAA